MDPKCGDFPSLNHMRCMYYFISGSLLQNFPCIPEWGGHPILGKLITVKL